MQEQTDEGLNIELDEQTAEGIYSNLVMIAHSPEEFILDFIRMMPGVPKAKVKSRIIMTPQHAKRFLGAMEENIDKYESVYGPISEGHQFDGEIHFQFPGGEAWKVPHKYKTDATFG